MADAAASSTRGGEGRRVLFISAGASHTVALLSGDLVFSWGRGEDGQLGHGDAEDHHLPTIFSAHNNNEILSITCGADHTTAYSHSKKNVYSWGWGDFGRLGHGNSTDLFIPQPISMLNGLEIKQIACGDSHCLAITGDGDVFSWGRNQNGQLGLGHTDDCNVPHKVLAFQGIAVTMLAAGAEHTVAVTESGKLYGWGWGRYGNLGLGDRSDRLVPTEVAAITGERMRQVACGWWHSISVAESGKLFTFGWSKYGQLGHGDFQDHLIPHQVQALKGIKIQYFGQVGSGNTEDQTSPQLVKALVDQKIIFAACGWRHTLALTERGNVYSWGWGTSGQLGHGDTVDCHRPKRIDLLSVDGQACQHLEGSPSANPASPRWISPAERYAVVPDEMLGPLAWQLHNSTQMEQQALASHQNSEGKSAEDASVPDTVMKRMRMWARIHLETSADTNERAEQEV